MELKHVTWIPPKRRRQLLIVPYGIETILRIVSLQSICLLIVPYGIETQEGYIQRLSGCILLIVPYGIETNIETFLGVAPMSFNCTLWNWNTSLPYTDMPALAFNCTLWNWNHVHRQGHRRHRFLLIVPYGIETLLTIILLYRAESFNCTLWNWNNADKEEDAKSVYLLIVPYGIETCFSIWDL